MTQPPLPHQTRYWARTEDRQRVVNGLFERAAAHYDRACDVMSLWSGRTYRREALERAGLRDGMEVLDVGTGTGQLALQAVSLIGPYGRVTGVDPSFKMMAAARNALDVFFVQGLGERLPFPDSRFDFITMAYALRHVSDLDLMFREYLRVLRPGGRVLVLELTRPASVPAMTMAQLYFGALVPWLVGALTRSADAARLMRFYWDTILECVPPEAVLTALCRTGFATPRRTVIRGIFSEYTATRSP
jgi:demethylmenaquinone methyltransferase/2-methoxy-6-polyprenyl-1,4-benzoquinol methylase